MASKYLEPSFFIIGERKCGTSSMYRYLLDHPDILPCKVKEPQFFSKSEWKRRLNYANYRALYPLRDSRADIVLEWYILNDRGEIVKTKVNYHRGEPQQEITGEASANTFYDVPPARVRKYYPGAKILLMLRDPVSRAWSHYRMFQRFAEEGRRLPFKLTDFHQDVQREIRNYEAGRRTYFVGQGVYADRLPDWQNIFRSHLYVLFAEDLKQDDCRTAIMNEITDLLDVCRYDFTDIMQQKFNVAKGVVMDPQSERTLRTFYQSHDIRLREILNRELPWHE